MPKTGKARYDDAVAYLAKFNAALSQRVKEVTRGRFVFTELCAVVETTGKYAGKNRVVDPILHTAVGSDRRHLPLTGGGR